MSVESPPPTSSLFTLPPLFHRLISPFPLKTYPPYPSPGKRTVEHPTLWVHPPLPSSTMTETSVLSRDVECLKWQAHVALRGVKDVRIRHDVSSFGALGGRLPNLQLPSSSSTFGVGGESGDGDGDGVLLPAHNIPTWVIDQVGGLGDLEGYVDSKARDESQAWIALLEGDVHAAFVLLSPSPSSSFFLHTLLQIPSEEGQREAEVEKVVVVPPPAPVSGLLSIVRPYGTRVQVGNVHARYREAIGALSDRLGTDSWFLGSKHPTTLDALAFAYIHSLLNSQSDTLRIEIARRVNLVAWERRVHEIVRAAFVLHSRGES